MKLYMIALIFGQVVAVVGPLPYDEEECRFRASVRQAVIRDHYDRGGRPSWDGQPITPADIEHNCIWRAERPKLDVH